ncbi:hypothetical protein AB2B41_22480 [Marimonas sp. MJW-29]|uniref:Uncharacterized protein n=1 Tax=Sulfitobacter sediminis TaxID=3234186 RepID=A0ABV3RTP2_9RHOB
MDTKETFNIGYDLAVDDSAILANEAFRGVNRRPDVPGFAETMLEYFDACQAQAKALLSVMAEDLGLPADYFVSLFSKPMSAIRLPHYPPASGAASEIGAGAHSDYGAIPSAALVNSR